MRSAKIYVTLLNNGYWRGVVVIEHPDLDEPHEQRNDLFHDPAEALDWARGVIDLLFADRVP